MNKIKKITKVFADCLLYLLSALRFGPSKYASDKSKRILVVKLDAIGDYILFRNFLEELRKSNIYKEYKISFLGNASVRNLAESLDAEFVDEFIWVKKKDIFKKPLYFLEIIGRIHNRFEIAIQATYSREFTSDLLIKYSGAQKRLGFKGDCNNISCVEKKISDKWYTELVEIKNDSFFEFYKNREFFSQILKTQLNINKPFININTLTIDNLVEPLDNFVVLFPGAQQYLRKWPAESFELIGGYLIDTFNCNIVICGSKSDVILAAKIKNNNKRIIDLTGKTNLAQLIKVMSRARLVISNDTSGAHIGAALNVPTIVLSQFNHYLRFVPYPKEINGKMICLLPHIFEDLSEEELIEKFESGSNEDISLISVDEVKEAINKFL